MKWLPRKEQNSKCLQDLSIKKHLSKIKLRAAILAVCLTGVGTFITSHISRVNDGTLASVSPHTLSAEVSHVANEITIKILGRDFLGSGFILQQEGEKYTVITNQHVLRAGEAPYTIQTPDGETYLAKVLTNINSAAYDLAILEFEAEGDTDTYKTATIGNSLFLQVGEPIFAAGFAAEKIKTSSVKSDRSLRMLTGFTFEKGRITVILDKALEEGYQIGYTNDVQKGMSGGPLLNSQGKVVGVNGKHAYPLWEAPDFYQDGSQPCPPLQELISRSSLAIPIEKGISLTPNLKSLKPATDLEATSSAPTSFSARLDSDTSNDTSRLIESMQQEAETTKNCQSPPQKSVINR